MSIVVAACVSLIHGLPADPPAHPRDAHREVVDDAPKAYEPPDVLPFAPFIPPGEPNPGIQVNTDADGNNIPGDAANEPSIAVDRIAPSRLVIGWRQFDTITSNFRQAGWAYSHDTGQSWTFPGVIEPGIFRSDPVLDVDADGNFFYCSLSADFACTMFRSVDGGVTWDDGTFAWGGDKQWFSIDRTDTATRNNFGMYWNATFAFSDGAFTRSVNGGQTFVNPIDLPTNLFWGSTSVAPTGALYLGGITGTFSPRIQRMLPSISPMELPTFDINIPVDIGGVLRSAAGPNPGGLLGQLWVVTDHSGGAADDDVCMLASVNPPGPDPLDVMFVRSTDGGFTWSEPLRINDDPLDMNAWQWFGTLAIAPNGRLDAIWYDTRLDPGGFDTAVYTSSSFDGGETWTDNVRLTPTFNPFLGYPNQNKIGDYVQLVSDNTGAHLAYTATFNGEQDVWYRRIGELDCNNNGTSDEIDILEGDVADANGNAIPDECEPDCNRNGVLDEFDVVDGVSIDCNENGVPDECETDCNGNGIPDTCDLADGFSVDLNENGLPDECEPPLNETCVQGFLVFVNETFGTRTITAIADGVPEACGTFGPDVWYRFIMPTAGRATINANTDYPARLALYDSTCPDEGGEAVDCADVGDTEPVTVVRNAPTLMRLRVGGIDGAEGEGEISIAFRRLDNGCPEDCSPFDQETNAGNGVVNISDLEAVLNVMGTNDPFCDVSPTNDDGTVGNGMINIDDLIAVIQSFGECP